MIRVPVAIIGEVLSVWPGKDVTQGNFFFPHQCFELTVCLILTLLITAISFSEKLGGGFRPFVVSFLEAFWILLRVKAKYFDHGSDGLFTGHAQITEFGKPFYRCVWVRRRGGGSPFTGACRLEGEALASLLSGIRTLEGLIALFPISLSDGVL